MDIKSRFLNLSTAVKAALTVAVAVLVIIGGLLGLYAMVTANEHHAEAQQSKQVAAMKADEDAAIKAAIAYSDSQWCGALTLLTSKPVPYPSDPTANPSRLETYDLYEDFVHVEMKFGCKTS